jgi:hypothetical protein
MTIKQFLKIEIFIKTSGRIYASFNSGYPMNIHKGQLHVKLWDIMNFIAIMVVHFVAIDTVIPYIDVCSHDL